MVINSQELLKKIRRVPYKLRSLYLTYIGPIIRQYKNPPLPENFDGLVLVHIGCGEFSDPRYINVDARAMPHVHYVSQTLNLDEFPYSSVDLIYACHVLEHVPHGKLEKTLCNWSDRLKPGGVLRISVPDFDHIVAIYKDQGNSIEAINEPLMGGQGYETNFHTSVFNQVFLKDLLLKCGFTIIRQWEPNKVPYHNFDDWSGRKYILGNEEYLISLNLEAVKK